MIIRGRSFLVAVFTITLLSAGCAKQEIIKKDETVPAASPVRDATPGPSKPTTSAIANPPIREEQASSRAVSSPASATAEAAYLSEALERIYFDFDSYTLPPASREVLAKNAETIKKGRADIRIEGNCDERGSDEYNLALGERRAKAAMKYLVTMGVDPKRLSVISYGKERPADPSHTEEAWAKNRRDEFSPVR